MVSFKGNPHSSHLTPTFQPSPAASTPRLLLLAPHPAQKNTIQQALGVALSPGSVSHSLTPQSLSLRFIDKGWEAQGD